MQKVLIGFLKPSKKNIHLVTLSFKLKSNVDFVEDLVDFFFSLL
jgi:hypothetical protein